MIDIKDLLVRYPDAWRPAVNGITLHVGSGEVFGFIGPNGAGKTSTLRVLAGLVRPESGTATIAGLDVVREPAAVRKRVGYLPDFFGIYDDLTCREYLEFFAAAQGLSRGRRESVVDEVLQLVDLVDKADQLAAALSRGMQQRLGLARVLVHEPDVLLLDEPASGLDPRARIEVREILRELGRMGKTVILSSHVLSDLASACTSVGIIEQGELVFAGSVKDALIEAAPSECTVRVSTIEGPQAAQAALESAGIAGATFAVHDGLLRVTLPLGARGSAGEQARLEAAASVASILHSRGLAVSHLEVERVDLERAFMTLTEGKLA
jgi:ABC-2 type transport system ATP-binding protein